MGESSLQGTSLVGRSPWKQPSGPYNNSCHGVDLVASVVVFSRSVTLFSFLNRNRMICPDSPLLDKGTVARMLELAVGSAGALFARR